MIAEILCIGTEILIGDIVNTNATYISKRLSENGFDVFYHSVCGDNPKRLENEVKQALSKCDLLVTTGGLGPTYDDITVSVCAKSLGVECEQNKQVEQTIRAYFEKSGRVMTENNLKQAFLPKGCVVFQNEWGTAPGVCFEKDGKVVVMLPGPPREMKPMLEKYVLPHLSRYTDHVLFSSNVNIIGIGESAVEEKLYELMTKSKNPTVALYVNDGEVRVRVTASGKNADEAKELVFDCVEKIKNVLGKFVYDVDSPSPAHSLVKLLKRSGAKISTAESCTGGLLSSAITSVPGASEVFGFGVCSYANEAKQALLGVDETTLSKFGAVSDIVAMQMAKGIRELSCSDIALSLTGIAGPDGGSDEKPVGLVYLGVATRDKLYAKKLLLGLHTSPDREYIRSLAVKNAIKTAIDEVMEFTYDRT